MSQIYQIYYIYQSTIYTKATRIQYIPVRIYVYTSYSTLTYTSTSYTRVSSFPRIVQYILVQYTFTDSQEEKWGFSYVWKNARKKLISLLTRNPQPSTLNPGQTPQMWSTSIPLLKKVILDSVFDKFEVSPHKPNLIPATLVLYSQYNTYEQLTTRPGQVALPGTGTNLNQSKCQWLQYIQVVASGQCIQCYELRVLVVQYKYIVL